jgi:hypothetical protein
MPANNSLVNRLTDESACDWETIAQVEVVNEYFTQNISFVGLQQARARCRPLTWPRHCLLQQRPPLSATAPQGGVAVGTG